MKHRGLLFPSAVLALLPALACKTTELSNAGRSVLPSLAPPVDMGYAPNQCRPLGTVVGKGGGSFGGAWISNEELTRYAMNDMLNAAAAKGANVVHHSAPQFGTSGDQYGSNVSSAMVTGTAYSCNGQPHTHVATVEHPPAQEAQVTTHNGPEGKLLRLTLLHESFAQSFVFAVKAPETVWWELGGPATARLAGCAPSMLIDGALKRFEWKKDGTGGRLVFATTVAEFQSILAAQRVVGRFCETEWRWSQAQRQQLTEFHERVKEELAWKTEK